MGTFFRGVKQEGEGRAGHRGLGVQDGQYQEEDGKAGK